MTTATMINENISLGVGLSYRFRGLVHDHHGGEHGSMQADMVQENCSWESYILQAMGSQLRHWVVS